MQFVNPLESFTQGLQVGDVMRQRRDARTQQQALDQELAAVFRDGRVPSSAELAGLATRHPQLAKPLEGIWDTLNAEQQAARASVVSDVYAALSNGDTDIAGDLLERDAFAAENGGNATLAKQARDLKQLVELSPETARTSLGLRLAGMLGPDKFAETFSKLETSRRATAREGADFTKAQADASKAAIDAKFAESQAALDLEKKGWDIFKIQEDATIARANSRTAAINAELARTTNDIKREELQLKLKDAQAKRDELVQAKAADVETALASMDNMLNTADRVLKTPLDTVGAAAGPLSSRLPTTTQDTADFEALVETLRSQSFMAQVPYLKGMGALSNAEGEKLQAALQNFSLKQSPERLLENVREAQRLILKARKNLADRYGVPESVPDTPAAELTNDELEALVYQYGGE